MIHIRAEGKPINKGFNFYPLSEWKTSFGFLLKLKSKVVICRYAYHVNKFYFWIYCEIN